MRGRRRAVRFRSLPLFALCAMALSAGCARQSGERLATIRVAGIPVRVEVADTPALRGKGLMFRESLPPDEGMLFVFDAPEVLSFYMKNTSIPLSIAFIDSSLTIVRIADMAPFDESPHSSVVPAQYALEMNQGWFRSRGVRPGASVEIPEALRR